MGIEDCLLTAGKRASAAFLFDDDVSNDLLLDMRSDPCGPYNCYNLLKIRV